MARGSKASVTGAKRKADLAFSLLVRSRGACEKCGRKPPEVQLQTAHIISRRFSHTRCELTNAFCLCAHHHAWFTDHPVEFGRFALAHIGEAEYERLFALSQQPGKVKWAEVYEALLADDA